MRSFALVVAADPRGGIGKDGTLPWHLPGDMALFKRITSQVRDSAKKNAVIMGRKTWESIPPKFRPLKNRLNVVITTDKARVDSEQAVVVSSFGEALTASDRNDVEKIYVIGGAAVYAEALRHPLCLMIHFTAIERDFDCDTFLPDFSGSFVEHDVSSDRQEDNGVPYRFKIYKRK